MCRSVQNAYWSKRLLRLNIQWQHWIQKLSYEKLAIVGHVHLVEFADNGNEMYKDSKRTLQNMTFFIKPTFGDVLVGVAVVVCWNAFPFQASISLFT